MRKAWLLVLLGVLAANVATAEEEPPAPEAPQVAESPAPPVHHALEQRKVGFYAVYLPPDHDREAARRWPVCVILHGSGSTETGHGGLADGFGREGVIYVAPRAPHAHREVFLEGDQPGWTAWPTWPDAWGDPEDASFPQAEVEKLAVERMYTDWIASCIRDVRARYRADDQRVVVVGHSQGAAFAHRLALHHPELVRAYFAYAGYYDDTLEDETTAAILRRHEIRPEVAHCEGDEVVDVEHGRSLAAYLEEHGVEHATHLLPGGSHGITSKIRRAAHAFVARTCRGEALPPLRGELVVTGVAEASQGAAAGLREGDVITAYAGVETRCIDDLRAALETVGEAETVELAWRRGEETFKADVKPGRIGVTLTDR